MPCLLPALPSLRLDGVEALSSHLWPCGLDKVLKGWTLMFLILKMGLRIVALTMMFEVTQAYYY